MLLILVEKYLQLKLQPIREGEAKKPVEDPKEWSAKGHHLFAAGMPLREQPAKDGCSDAYTFWEAVLPCYSETLDKNDLEYLNYKNIPTLCLLMK